MCPGSFTNEVEQKHIDKQTDMISDAVSAMHIDVVSRKIPDLNNSKCAKNIGDEHLSVNKSICYLMQERIIPADYINKDQVVYQFKILDFFFRPFW